MRLSGGIGLRGRRPGLKPMADRRSLSEAGGVVGEPLAAPFRVPRAGSMADGWVPEWKVGFWNWGRADCNLPHLRMFAFDNGR
jgi:hypothetical protein